MTLVARETVIWINKDNVAHTVTGFGIDEKVQPGQSITHTFNETGSYDYVCTIHPGMTGTVIVK